jgi:VanZ family protein
MVKGTSFFSFLLGLLFAIWLVALWILSSLPGAQIELPPFLWSDKGAHFGYFFVGGLLLAWLLRRTLRWRTGRLTAAVLCAMALIGGLDEIHQLYAPGRSGGDWTDWLANCAGGAAGAFMIGWIYARSRDRRPQAPSPVVVEANRAP